MNNGSQEICTKDVLRVAKQEISVFDRPSRLTSLTLITIIERQQKALQEIADLPGCRIDESCYIALGCLETGE